MGLCYLLPKRPKRVVYANYYYYYLKNPSYIYKEIFTNNKVESGRVYTMDLITSFPM